MTRGSEVVELQESRELIINDSHLRLDGLLEAGLTTYSFTIPNPGPATDFVFAEVVNTGTGQSIRVLPCPCNSKCNRDPASISQDQSITLLWDGLTSECLLAPTGAYGLKFIHTVTGVTLWSNVLKHDDYD